MMKMERVRLLKDGERRKGPVMYWMSRDQRVQDNWALIHAAHMAREKKEALIVVFCLVPQFLNATMRQYGFMLRGLREVKTRLFKKNIHFFILKGQPEKELPRFITTCGAGTLFCDFDPLALKRTWKEAVAKRIDIPFYEVDAHNIVPCWISSQKQEYAARTFRPKIQKLLPHFLEAIPRLQKHPFTSEIPSECIEWESIQQSLKIDRAVREVSWLIPGESAARGVLRDFIECKLGVYDARRNNPTHDGQSHLSPYLHFGQISAQRVALEVRSSSVDPAAYESFLEELIGRRELADNFCYYNPRYDSYEGFPSWARKTLEEHAGDKREYLYSKRQLEKAETHDDLWNAAQMQMVVTGKMHGYMRMYWAKKILEWSASPQEALVRAIYLNDRYEIDGRDPSGYVGCAWSIGGVHDRAWFQRPVFGKIRYMSYNGCRSKFDVDLYIRNVHSM